MLIRRPSSLVLAIMQSTILPATAFLLSPRHDAFVVMDHDCHDAATMVVMSSSSSHHHHGRPLTFLGAKSKASADSTTPDSSNTTASSTTASSTATTTAWQDLSQAAQDVWTSIRDAPERYKLKQDLILQGASYDRGFGASPVARQKVADMVQELISMNPCEEATRHFSGKQRGRGDNDGNLQQQEQEQESPLKGTWVLVWTTAQDVLALHASPFTVVGAMYQVVEPPVLTTIVDLIPRAQELVPPDKIRSTLFRGKVKKMGSAANNKKKKNTLDVTLESFNVKAVEVFGRKTGAAIPAWATQIPKLPGTDSNTVLEIAYLDDSMMITKQKAPGGTNVFVKVPNAEV